MRGRWMAGLAAAALALSAAGDEAGAASGRRGTYLFVHQSRSPNRIHAFRWERDGSLTAVAGSPFPTGLADTNCSSNCQTLGWSQKRRALLASGGGGTVAAVLVAPGGAMSVGPNSPYPLPGASGSALGIHAADSGGGSWVYVNAFADDRVHGLALGADGTLSGIGGSPWTTGDAPDGIAVTKRHVLCANDNPKTISAFAIGPDGALAEAPGSPFAMGTGFSFNLHADRKGRRVYVGDVNDGDVAVHDIDRATGALSLVDGSPFRFDTFNAGSGVALLSKKLAVVVPTSAATGVQAARIAKDGGLAPLGGLQDRQFAGLTAHAASPDGSFLAVAQGTSVRTFSVHRKTGELTAVDSEPLGGIAQGMRAVVR